MEEIVAKMGSIPDVISKDECIYCFETSFNHRHRHDDDSEKGGEEGKDDDDVHSLNICLQCFQTVCGRHVSVHRQAAFVCQDMDHALYLNFWKIEKVDDGIESGNKNKKLKLEVVEKSQEELYETVWKLVRYLPLNVDDGEDGEYEVLLRSSDEGMPTPDFIDKIGRARSQDLVDQTHSWELDIKSCEHVSRFVNATSPRQLIRDIDLDNEEMRCSQCDLDSNLWLCLHCGNIGCGREQVGIEGHGHALSHVSDHRDHSLAVKLGSLSQDTNDVYCYSCDDEVRFPDDGLSHLLVDLYGIDLKGVSRVKEKTLVELQVEQNMKWDFKMTDSQGSELVRLPCGDLYGVGLINLGNSCYMNSILQVMFHDPEWVMKLVDEELDDDVDFPRDVMYPMNNLRCQWIKLYRAWKLESERYPSGIKPSSFQRCVAGDNDEFRSMRQQDAMEYFTFLIDKVRSLNDVTGFQLVDRIECVKCHGVRYSDQNANSIQVALPEGGAMGGVHLTRQLDQYFTRNDDDDIRFECPQCQGSQMAIKQLMMGTAPDTLVLNVMRMQIDKNNWSVVKTSDRIEYDSTITLDRYSKSHFQNENEMLLPVGDHPEFTPREDILSQLKEMGFSDNACIRALYHTGNGADGDIAVQWLFEHIEDSDINDPLTIASGKNDAELVKKAHEMSEMGLGYDKCLKALKLNDGDMNRSVEWVFTHGEEAEEEAKEVEKREEKVGHEEICGVSYELSDVVCHKGASVQSGHYVMFHRSVDASTQETHWILYNDEKIVQYDTDEDEIKRNGYIFIYKRV